MAACAYLKECGLASNGRPRTVGQVTHAFRKLPKEAILLCTRFPKSYPLNYEPYNAMPHCRDGSTFVMPNYWRFRGNRAIPALLFAITYYYNFYCNYATFLRCGM